MTSVLLMKFFLLIAILKDGFLIMDLPWQYDSESRKTMLYLICVFVLVCVGDAVVLSRCAAAAFSFQVTGGLKLNVYVCVSVCGGFEVYTRTTRTPKANNLSVDCFVSPDN